MAKQRQIHPVQDSRLLDGVEGRFEKRAATQRHDPEKLYTELYEQNGRLPMVLTWVRREI